MVVTQQEYLEKLCKSYSAYYDISMAEKNAFPLLAELEMHKTETKTAFLGVLTLAEIKTNHYIYVFGTENLTEDVLDSCCEVARKKALKKIKPDSTHMESLVTALFLYNKTENSVLKKAKKKKFTKSFLFSFHGWMRFETKTINLSAI
ncbi:MAG: hypothetical protein Q4C78_00640 [Synergistaceae bacterium]|nr:hypothetical protein [Synergistaceae bacterium]